MDRASESLENEEWDARYFGLIYELAEKNRSRYELQTEQLLKIGFLNIECDGAVIEFKLTPTGCSFSTVDSASARSSSSWIRMGWGKSAKREALPHYFAQAEASVLIDRQDR